MTEILERDDVFEGPLRRPRNLHQQAPNSIHNDAVAKKLGFRGGTVAGSIHMEQFPPLLLRAFGDAWWESGNLSLYFTHATTDAEDVRCFVARPEPKAEWPQVDVRMERDDGTRVCEGTASVGRPEAPSALRERIAHLREPGELRMLAGLAGDAYERCRVVGII